MKISDCVPERMSKSLIGGLLLALGLALFVSGFTVLPVFGLVLSVPFIFLAVYFFRVHLNDQCEIDPDELETEDT